MLSVQQKFLCDCFFSTSTKKQFQLKLVKSCVEMTFWAEGGGGRERRLQLISPTLASVPCMERVCTSPAKGVRSRNKYAQVVSPRKYVARHTHRKTRVVPITCHLWDRYCITHGNQVTNDASVACNLSSQPNTSYVPQHTPTVNSTLPPKGVSKHHPNLFRPNNVDNQLQHLSCT